MTDYTLYTLFYGTTLCDLISNSIIEYLNEFYPNHLSNIITVNFGSVFLIGGHTSVSNELQLNTIIKNFFEDNFNYIRIWNIKDSINYGKNILLDNVVIHTFNYDNEFKRKYKEKVGKLISRNYQGFISYCPISDKIFTNNLKLSEGFTLISDTNKPYQSSEFFSNSLSHFKSYYWFLNYISENLLSSGICSDIHIKFIYNVKDLPNLNEENFTLEIDSNSSLYEKSKIKSMILDLFNFDLNYINSVFQLNKIDFTSDIILTQQSWMINDRVSEMILV